MTKTNKIELDMFDVGLGSSILTQLYLENEPVRILADAGIVAKGEYTQDWVHYKLKQKFDNQFRLDLIVGTHYDQDHLAGLVPIINDKNIEIGEVWLPPVNDFSKHHNDKELKAEVTEENTLAQLIFKGEVKLSEQLKKTHEIANYLNDRLRVLATNNDIKFEFEPELKNNENTTQLEIFKQLEFIAENILKQTTHENEFDCFKDHLFLHSWHLNYILDLTNIANDRDNIVALAYIQKAVCKSAITATYLSQVIDAINARNASSTSKKIALKTYLLHNAGNPRLFSWDTQGKVFNESASSDNLPKITLLGPSTELKNRYLSKLPEMYYLSLYDIKRTTPSNRLSYVFNIEYLGQKIHICGDTGFFDFRPTRKRILYTKLAAELKNINVLQVAHHAGNNEYFYEGLKQADFLSEPDIKYLLVQHEYHDENRPNSSFHDFVLDRDRQAKGKSQILFTCEPDSTRICCYKHLIAPREGAKADKDDVSLEFVHNDWKVTKHAIEI